MEPTISIITATYNSEATIERTVLSVLNQTVYPIEYIVMDGGSTDETLEIIERYRDKFRKAGVDLIVKSESDYGMYDAINKAISIAKGDIIGNVNSDDYYEHDTVETVINTYIETNFDMMYADLRIITENRTNIKKAKYTKFATTRNWNHPTTFITNKVYIDNKYKVESMYDDCDLMLRIRKKGYKIVIVNKVLSNFCFGGMSTTKNLVDMIKRIKLRCFIYKNNGYGFVYYIDSVVTEVIKYILA